MVTSSLPPFTKRGAHVDLSVSSIGDAVSLEGGMLLMTPLQDEGGEIYVMGQGALSVGGYTVGKVKSTVRKKNHTLSGEIPGGGIVKKEVMGNELNAKKVSVSLFTPDFTSAVEMAKAINTRLNLTGARTLDAATVEVAVPDAYQDSLMAFISAVELTEFTPSRCAKVIINEKTGTIVTGAEVKIEEVAVSHGSITVTVQKNAQVSQPLPLSQGVTQVVPQSQVTVEEERPEMVVLNKSANVGDLARALNNIGVTPRDIICIFQAIKKAGAMNADLVIM
jgi:flagellar P-ring protein precursor FlgI